MTAMPSTWLRVLATTLLLLLGRAATAGEDGWTPLGADDHFGVWHQPTGDWYVAGDAMVDSSDSKRLAGKPGAGVMINGKTGRTRSLVTKQTFDDVELHVEFMVAKGSNSGVIFHGNYEIQILDSHGIEKPTAGHCGGIYPRAEAKPSYHHIDEGSPPKVNAAKPPGEWQTFDIIFQAPRFDKAGRKTAHARFVKVVHNGQVIQEDQEVPYATGTNWDRKQVPRGPIIFQGDYGPVALRNVRVRTWKAGAEQLNVPPEGFTALFNGRDFRPNHLLSALQHSPQDLPREIRSSRDLCSPGHGASMLQQKPDKVGSIDVRPTARQSSIVGLALYERCLAGPDFFSIDFRPTARQSSIVGLVLYERCLVSPGSSWIDVSLTLQNRRRCSGLYRSPRRRTVPSAGIERRVVRTLPRRPHTRSRWSASPGSAGGVYRRHPASSEAH